MTSDQPTTDNAFSLADSFRRPRTWVSFGLAVMMIYFIFRSLDISVAETIAEMRMANPQYHILAVLIFYIGILIFEDNDY
jgi:uncharacterized membrane protein YbhN (UPF0104 family)